MSDFSTDIGKIIWLNNFSEVTTWRYLNLDY